MVLSKLLTFGDKLQYHSIDGKKSFVNLIGQIQTGQVLCLEKDEEII